MRRISMRILERVDFNKYANSFKMEYEKFARTFKNWDSYEYQAMDQDAYDEIWKKVFGSFVDDSYYDDWMEFFDPIIQEIEMKVFGRVAESSDKNVVEIQEEVRIPQGDQDIILEKGDKIRILENNVYSLFSENDRGRKLIASKNFLNDKEAMEFFGNLIDEWGENFDFDRPERTDHILKLREGDNVILVFPDGREMMYAGEWEDA
jgi:hypothetical protein